MERRKIYCEEDVENMKLSEVKEMCGYIEPVEGAREAWTVKCLEKGVEVEFGNQQNAEIYANTEMIKGMLLKRK